MPLYDALPAAPSPIASVTAWPFASAACRIVKFLPSSRFELDAEVGHRLDGGDPEHRLLPDRDVAPELEAHGLRAGRAGDEEDGEQDGGDADPAHR